jgi:hypothetical protein
VRKGGSESDPVIMSALRKMVAMRREYGW